MSGEKLKVKACQSATSTKTKVRDELMRKARMRALHAPTRQSGHEKAVASTPKRNRILRLFAARFPSAHYNATIDIA